MFTLLTPRIKALPLYLAGAGVQTPEGNLRRPHGQELHQVALVTRGSGILLYRNQRYRLNSGDCFCLAKNEAHHYFPLEPPMHTLWLLFDGEAGDRLMSLLTDAAGGGAFSPAAPAVLTAKGHAILSRAEAGADGVRLSAMLYDFLLEALHQKEASDHRHASAGRLAPALHFMEQNFRSAPSLEEIAATCSLSKYQFCKLFHRAYQMTPFAYLIQLRLQNAKTLLSQDLSASVKEAALSSGFRDVSYFGAVFRRFEGITPKEFQLQYGKK